MKIVQIGCNNGDDDIFPIIKSGNVEFALLVDANPFVLELTKEKYKDFKNVKIECHLISDKNIETKFYIPHFDSHKYSQHSSTSIEHIKKHGHELKDVREFLMKSITINDLLTQNNLFEIDYLYVDCEGEDFNIINNIDFKIFNIKKITFEHDHIPDRATNYLYICNKLNELGYIVENTNLGNVTFSKI